MRIKCKQRDYYDSLQAGVEKSDCVYIRHTKHETITNCVIGGEELIRILNEKVKNKFTYHGVFIGFAGKVYFGIMRHPQQDAVKYGTLTKESNNKVYVDAIYTVEKFKEFLEQNVENHVIKKYTYYRAKRNQTIHSYLIGLFEKEQNNISDHIGKFFAIAPIWAADQFYSGYRGTVNVTYNPILSLYEFGKVLSPHEAYNQLWRYIVISGRPEMEMPKISDEMNVQRHGFDPKYGFRKLPSKKK